jgi:GTPase SAR1 family protein
MGNLFSALRARLWPAAKHRICIMGPDAAGKTSVLYRLFLNEFVQTIPSQGMNVEVVKHANLELIMWDIMNVRPTWQYYVANPNSNALIVVVDSAGASSCS